MGYHNYQCATAAGTKCECSGCSGALHGWPMWIIMVDPTPAEQRSARENPDTRRAAASAKKKKAFDPEKRRPNNRSRDAFADIARLDIVDWLRKQDFTSPGPTGGDPFSGRVATAEDSPTRYAMHVVGEASGIAEYDKTLGKVLSNPDHSKLSTQMALLAAAVTGPAWRELEQLLGRDTATRKQLANHFWCDFFIGVVKFLRSVHDLLEATRDQFKNVLKESLTASSIQRHIEEYVVDKVIDKAWEALTEALSSTSPVFAVLSNEQTIRSFRILAVFACPDIKNHKEVYQLGLKPLVDDAEGIVVSETREDFISLFKKFEEDGGAS